MKPEEKNIDEAVKRYWSSPSQEEAQSDCDRVLHHLRTAAEHGPQERRAGSRFLPFFRTRFAMVSAAAAVFLAVVLGATIMQQRPFAVIEKSGATVAVGEVVHATVAVGEVVRAAGDGRALVLADGSRIEMRAGAEAVVENVSDGLMIRLNSGSMMVFAAKQAAGRHLYVQTRDLKVSVVGTVFLVNADDNGSRVAVIEGEVRVQQGARETSLLPGEQFPFNPKSEDLKFFRETGWSREAFAYLSKLHESMAKSLAARQSRGRTPTVSEKAQFEEASIRLCEQDIQAPEGARGGGSGSIKLSPGRVDALCMTAATLIRVAHRALNNNGGRGELRMNATSGLPPEDGMRVRGGPDWVRSEKYTIAAVGDSTDAPTLQRTMLLDLLERRLKLKVRVDTEEIPVYALTIAKSGLKIEPIELGPEWYARINAIAGTENARRQPNPEELSEMMKLLGLMGCDRQPEAEAARNDPAQLNRSREAVRRGAQPPRCGKGFYSDGPNVVLSYGGRGISSLAEDLSESRSRLPDTLSGLLVVDKTGLPTADCFLAIPPAGTRCAPLFNFVVEYAADETFFTNAEFATLRNGRTPDSSVPKAPNIFDALEKLGLHLEKSKGSREFIVIEHIERPSPN